MIIVSRIPLGHGRHLAPGADVSSVGEAPVRIGDTVVGKVVSARADGDAIVVELDVDESKAPAGWISGDWPGELSLDLHLDVSKGRPA